MPSAETVEETAARAYRYRWMHMVLALVHVLSFVVAFSVVSHKELWLSFPVVYSYFSRFDLMNTLVDVGSVDPVILAMCSPIPSAIGHMLIALSRAPPFAANIVRYIDYGLSSPLMIFSIAILAGVNDFLQGTFISILQATLCFIGGVAGRTKEREHAYFLFGLSSFIHVAVWGGLLAAVILPDGKRSEWALAMMTALFLVFSLFAIVDALRLSQRITEDRADFWFLVLSATAKIYLQWLILNGALALRNQLLSEDPTLTDFFITTAAVFTFSIFLTIALYFLERRLRAMK